MDPLDLKGSWMDTLPLLVNMYGLLGNLTLLAV